MANPLPSTRAMAAWGKTSPRTRRLLCAIAAAIFVWLGLVSFVLPQRAARLRLEEEVQTLLPGTEALRLQLEALRNEARGEEAMQQSLVDIRRQLAETLARLPESRALSSFLRDLTAPEAGGGIVFLSITPRPLETRGEFLELPFTLELEGSYQALTRYLTRLEALPRLVTVQSITLNAAGDRSPELRASVAAATYVLGTAP